MPDASSVAKLFASIAASGEVDADSLPLLDIFQISIEIIFHKLSNAFILITQALKDTQALLASALNTIRGSAA